MVENVKLNQWKLEHDVIIMIITERERERVHWLIYWCLCHLNIEWTSRNMIFTPFHYQKIFALLLDVVRDVVLVSHGMLDKDLIYWWGVSWSNHTNE